ncbi:MULTISPECIES: hypothetical protein [unclassified Streptomyces]|uniref:hypothetical protein n=1 Tax=unclassified Streptomyces TaxID=2593676 RepID=UPI0033295472
MIGDTTGRSASLGALSIPPQIPTPGLAVTNGYDSYIDVLDKICFFRLVVITVQAGMGKTRAQNEAISKQPFCDDRRLHRTAVVS